VLLGEPGKRLALGVYAEAELLGLFDYEGVVRADGVLGQLVAAPLSDLEVVAEQFNNLEVEGKSQVVVLQRLFLPLLDEQFTVFLGEGAAIGDESSRKHYVSTNCGVLSVQHS
jgi:hypothetical protein